MSRAEMPLLALVWLSLASSPAVPEEALPEDDFLEYLGAWDEAWEQACAPEGYLPGDAACEPTDDDRDDEDN